MPTAKTPLEVRLYMALKRITCYMSPEKLRIRSVRQYGLEPEEAVEMAYENVLGEAKAALKGVRIPKKEPPR